MKIVENYIKVFIGYRPNIWKWIVVSLVFTFCDVPLNNRFIRNIYWIIRTEHKCSRLLLINITSNQRWFKSLKNIKFFFSILWKNSYRQLNEVLLTYTYVPWVLSLIVAPPLWLKYCWYGVKHYIINQSIS